MMNFKTIDTSKSGTREIQGILTSAIAPRPIAFASTIDKDGKPNLSPFSFFNAFGANPPILIFSPARRGKDNTTKHTFNNIKDVPEVVINVVNFEIVEQMSLSSSDFAKGVNEFAKAGLTAIPSESIRPFRVKESPVQFECTVQQVIETGTEGGAGNLVICHVNRIHINEEVLDTNGNIDAHLIDLVGRMGGSDYVRTRDALFTVPKPLTGLGIGVDALPQHIRESKFLNGMQLSRLASVDRLPSAEEISSRQDFFKGIGESATDYVDSLIEKGDAWDALCYLMS